MNFLQITMLVTYAYLLLIPLKFFRIIPLSWWWIFSPLIAIISLAVLYVLIILIIYFIKTKLINASK